MAHPSKAFTFAVTPRSASADYFEKSKKDNLQRVARFMEKYKKYNLSAEEEILRVKDG